MSVFTNEIAVTNTVTVDGSAQTQPVSAASLPLPTGAATSGNQTTGNSSLSSIDGKTPALGQTTMAGSTPVVFASNQTALPVTMGVGATGTITRVNTAATTVLLKAANVNRKSLIVMTETGSANYVAFAATASIIAYTFLMGSNTSLIITGYTGDVSMVRSTGTGTVQVTEVV